MQKSVFRVNEFCVITGSNSGRGAKNLFRLNERLAGHVVRLLVVIVFLSSVGIFQLMEWEYDKRATGTNN